MGRLELRDDEAEVLRAVLQAIVVHPTSGVIGVVHGNSRFVATRYGIAPAKLDALDSLARKVGAGPVSTTDATPQ